MAETEALARSTTHVGLASASTHSERHRVKTRGTTLDVDADQIGFDVPGIAQPEPGKTRDGPRLTARTAVAIAYILGIFMIAMDTHIVNVALPSISRTFHEPLASAQWTAIGYVLGLSMLIPTSGWIGDHLGTKRTFVVSLATFVGASILCGQARSLAELALFRFVQGVGGGLLIPTTTTMFVSAVWPRRKSPHHTDVDPSDRPRSRVRSGHWGFSDRKLKLALDILRQRAHWADNVGNWSDTN